MRMDRKWIVLAAFLCVAMLTTGCPKDEPEVKPPPQVTETAPEPVDVPAKPEPAPPVDQEEKKSDTKTIQELNNQGLIGDVFFDFDKYDLRAEAKERLARNAEFMNSTAGREYRFIVEGHCDERGTSEYNLALGESRSEMAIDYLASLGVDRSRLESRTYGESRQFCTESTEACWQQNRRAHFSVPREDR